MGPNDPFSNDFPGYTSQEEFEPQTSSTRPPLTTSSTVLGIGAATGASVGVLSLFVSWVDVFQVILFAGLGIALSWFGMGLVSGRFDFKAAWQALIKKNTH